MVYNGKDNVKLKQKLDSAPTEQANEHDLNAAKLLKDWQNDNIDSSADNSAQPASQTDSQNPQKSIIGFRRAIKQLTATIKTQQQKPPTNQAEPSLQLSSSVTRRSVVLVRGKQTSNLRAGQQQADKGSSNTGILRKGSGKRTEIGQAQSPSGNDGLRRRLWTRIVNEAQKLSPSDSVGKNQASKLTQANARASIVIMNKKPEADKDVSQAPRVTIAPVVRARDQLTAALKTQTIATKWRTKSSQRVLPLLAPFVPMLLQRDICKIAPNYKSILQAKTVQGTSLRIDVENLQPHMDTFVGAVMVADVTGFTKLTEKLSKKGSHGVELLTHCMNDFFSKVIRVIYEYGGDVMKFAGDSVIVAFYPDQDEATADDAGLKAATHRAAHCAVELAESLGHMRMLANGSVVRMTKEELAKFEESAAAPTTTDPGPRGSISGPAQNQSQKQAAGVTFKDVDSESPLGDSNDRNWWKAGGNMFGAARAFLKSGEDYSQVDGNYGGPMSLSNSGRVHNSSASDELSADRRKLSVKSVHVLKSDSVTEQTRIIQRQQSILRKDKGHKSRTNMSLKNLLSIKAARLDNGDLGPQHRQHSDQPANHNPENMDFDAPPELTGLHFIRSQHDSDTNAGTATRQSRFSMSQSHFTDKILDDDTATLVQEVGQQKSAKSMTMKRMNGSVGTGADAKNNAARTQSAELGSEIVLPGQANTSAPVAEGARCSDGTSAALEIEHRDSLTSNSTCPAQDCQPTTLLPLSSEDSNKSFWKQLMPYLQLHNKRAGHTHDQYDAYQDMITSPMSAPQSVRHCLQASETGVRQEQCTGIQFGSGSSSSHAMNRFASVLSYSGSNLGPLQSSPDMNSASRQHTLSQTKQRKRGVRVNRRLAVGEAAESLPNTPTSQPDSLSPLPLPHQQVQAQSRVPRVSVVGSVFGKLGAAQKHAQQMQLQMLAEQQAQPSSHSANLTAGTVFAATQLHTKNRLRQKQMRAAGELKKAANAGGEQPAAEEQIDKLSLKMIVGAGKVCVFHLGGYRLRRVLNAGDLLTNNDKETGRWEFFIGDWPHGKKLDDHGRRQPITQIGQIEDHANAGDVIVSREVLDLIGNFCYFIDLGDGNGRVLEMKTGFRKMLSSQTDLRQQFDSLTKIVQNRAVGVLRLHIVENIRPRLEAGHQDYVNEIRHLTVLFLGFPSLTDEYENVPTESEAYKPIQHAVEVVQHRMLEFGGSFLQFRCDEKGFLSICAFGLPGKTHEDNPQRAVHAAKAIVEDMKAKGERACVGITTGDLLCAIVGSSIRAEYTVFGDSINLSARLMCKAKIGMGDVLVDHPTYQQTKDVARYSDLEPLQVKGKTEVLQVHRMELNESMQYKPQPTLQSKQASVVQSMSQRNTLFVGRVTEVKAVHEALQQCVDDAVGQVLLLEGDSGLGKSAILEFLHSEDGVVRKMNVSMAKGAGDQAYKSLPLYPWRSVYQELFRLDRQAWNARQEANQEGTGRKGSKADAVGTRDEECKEDEEAQSTELGQRMTSSVDDYEQWRAQLAESLGLPLSTIPVGEQSLSQTTSQPESIRNQASRTFNKTSSFNSTNSRNSEQSRKGSNMDKITYGPRKESRIQSRDLVFINGQKRSRSFTNASSSTERRLHPSHSKNSVDIFKTYIDQRQGSICYSDADEVQDQGSEEEAPAIALVNQLSPTAHANRLPPLVRTAPAPVAEQVQQSGAAASVAATSSTQIPGGEQSAESVPQAQRGSQTLQGQGKLKDKALKKGGWNSFREADADITVPFAKRGRNMSRSGLIQSKGELTTELKKQRTLELLLYILVEYLRINGPLLILLDDLTMFDTTSWQLLTMLAEQLFILNLQVVVVATFCPSDEILNAEARTTHGKEYLTQQVYSSFDQLVKTNCTQRLTLKPFTKQEVAVMLQESLGEVDVDDLVSIIYNKSDGMPVYVNELNQVLSQMKIQIEAELGHEQGQDNKKAILNKLTERIKNQTSISHVIMERIDRLRPSHQLTLKVASVLGMKINVELLAAIYPVDPVNVLQAVKKDMNELVKQNFLKRESSLNSYTFCTSTARNVVYGVIPTYQRRALHAAVARQLETQVNTPTQHVAYHWTQSCVGAEVQEPEHAVKAMEWWVRAATQAKQAEMYAEALSLFLKAIHITDILLEHVQKQLSSKFRTGSNEDMTAKKPLVQCYDKACYYCEVADLNLLVAQKSVYNDQESYSMYLQQAQLDALLALGLLGAPVYNSDEFEKLSDAARPWFQRMQRSLCCSTGEDLHNYHVVEPERIQALGFQQEYVTEQFVLAPTGKTGTSIPAQSTEIKRALMIITKSCALDLPVDITLLKYCLSVARYFSFYNADAVLLFDEVNIAVEETLMKVHDSGSTNNNTHNNSVSDNDSYNISSNAIHAGSASDSVSQALNQSSNATMSAPIASASLTKRKDAGGQLSATAPVQSDAYNNKSTKMAHQQPTSPKQKKQLPQLEQLLSQ